MGGVRFECTVLLLDEPWVEAGMAAMGRAHDVVDAGVVRGNQHLSRFGRSARAVIDAGKYVAVDVEHALLLSGWVVKSKGVSASPICKTKRYGLCGFCLRALPLFCWDLARVDLGRRKLLAASNAATRLCAITRMAAADWKHIDEVALRLVEDAVACAGLDAARYLELAGGVSFSKTHGRRALGCMNDLSRMLGPARIDMGEKLQWREMELLNCRLVPKCAGHEGYVVPAIRS